MDRGWSQGSKARIGAYTGPAGSLRCQTTRLLLAKKKNPGGALPDRKSGVRLCSCGVMNIMMAWPGMRIERC
jgi:hypothetical protein